MKHAEFFKVVLLWMLAASLAGRLRAQSGIPLPLVNTSNRVSVLQFGAVGNGVTTNTAAIQAAITAVSSAGFTNGLAGGVVEIPAGVFLSGPLNLASYTGLQLDAGATLEMLPYGSYPGGTSPTDFISGSKVHDVEILGSGKIDGQGAAWWAAYSAAHGSLSRPKAMIAGSSCGNMLIQGVTLQNPPNTHISFRYVCTNVTVDGIDINTTNPSPNTDGIDCSGANVLIENSHISDGDDHIAMGDGNPGDFNHDITIRGCLFGNGHGVSIGSYTQGGLSNLLVEDCIWTNGSSGIHLKSDDGRGGLVQNLTYLNLAMTNTQIPVFFYSYYTNGGTSTGVSVASAAKYPALALVSTTPVWRNIIISNLTAQPASGYPAGIIWGKPEMAISNVVMDRVNITASHYFEIYHARGIVMRDCQITVPGTNQLALLDAGVDLTNQISPCVEVLIEGISTNGYANDLALSQAPASLTASNMLGGDTVLTLAGSILTVSNNWEMTRSNEVNYALGTNLAEVVVKGNLTLGGTNNIEAGNGFAPGTYELISYSGRLNGVLPALGSVPEGFSCALDTNTEGFVDLIVTPSLPAAPGQLTAQPTNLEVLLRWDAVPGAVSYNVHRGTQDGVYTAGFSNLLAASFTDTNVQPESSYYYVVNANGTNGAGPYSAEVSATPLPSQIPSHLYFSAIAGQVVLGWPSDHLGWRLEMLTNDLNAGLGTNWTTVPNSTLTNEMSPPFNTGIGVVFYRLVFP